MVAFAANSVLCRLALIDTNISPELFSAIRLISGAIILAPILFIKRSQLEFNLKESLLKAIPLFTYALFFSLAYIKIKAGMGALILFATVQITMIGFSLIQGARLNKFEWSGFALAFGGLVYLLLPGLEAPPLKSSLLMLISGVSWGAYSLLGKGAGDPIIASAKNFLVASFLSLFLFFFIKGQINLMDRGVILAIISGAITSGLGYVLWYITLREISTTFASIVQLSVPIIAALGGVIFVSESLTMRLVISSIFIFMGIFLNIRAKRS